MTQSALYALDDLVLRLDSAEPIREDLHLVVRELSWVTIPSRVDTATLRIAIKTSNAGTQIPPNCREVLRTDDFRGFELRAEFFLTDGSSVFHLRPDLGEAYATIAPPFFCKSTIARANFWCFGVLKLLRPLGVYSLHAAGLATPDGSGVLLVGSSGCGKSTLAIGLIRAGWNYLSDDAVLLRHRSHQVEALACRRSFYIDAARSADYSDLSLGEEEPDSNGGRRRKVAIAEAYPEHYIPHSLPRIVIFPNITAHSQSMLKPIGRVSALRSLLAQSAPQLFDGSTMSAHLDLLNRLLRQAETYELKAGSDLYQQPAKLIDLIRIARGAENCRVS